MAEKVVHSAGPDREFGLQPAVGPRLCLIGVFQIVLLQSSHVLHV